MAELLDHDSLPAIMSQTESSTQAASAATGVFSRSTFEASILAFPFVDARIAGAVLVCTNRQPKRRLLLLRHPDSLLFGSFLGLERNSIG